MNSHYNLRFSVHSYFIALSFFFISSISFAQRASFQELDFRSSNNFGYFDFAYSFQGKTTTQRFRKYSLERNKTSFEIRRGRKNITQEIYTHIKGDLKINSRGELHISKGHTLIIFGDVKIATGATLINNGNLVVRGNLTIGNSTGKKKGKHKDIGPQNVRFYNRRGSNLYVKGNLIGVHPHGVELNGAIAIDGNVGFHFHLGPNKMNDNQVFYYLENRHFSVNHKIEGGDKDVFIDRLKKSPGTFSHLPNDKQNIKEVSLKKLLPYLDEELPVELINFDIDNTDHFHLLSWSTAQEINNSHFIIEQSYDNRHFEEIGRVNGNGNSNTEINYEFKVESHASQRVYYRLKQVDFDGRSESWLNSVRGQNSNNKLIVEVYPNPTANTIHVLFNNQDFENIQYYLINASTGTQKEITGGYQNNLTYKKFDLSSYSPGVYLLKATANGKEIFNKKIIKQ